MNGKRKKICVFIGSRANYSSIRSVLKKLRDSDNFELSIVAGASALLDRFGMVVNQIKKEGFEITAEIHVIIEGETPITMAKSAGLCIIESATILNNIQPDLVFVIGDRFEVLGFATAAAYMNIPIAHTMGGEVSGSIDESVRHVVTKLSHIHFPATELSAQRIRMMGEPEDNIFTVGCPRIDEIKEILDKKIDVADELFAHGVGSTFDLSKPFFVALYHPVTTEYGQGIKQIKTILDVVDKMAINTVMFWPNADAGSDDIARGIRSLRERSCLEHFRFRKNLPMDVFITLVDNCSCMIGNSSSAIREGAFIGVSAVNIGTRQDGRERGKNVIDVGYSADEIRAAIEKSVKHGKYERDTLYGDGLASERIVEILRNTDMKIQKRFADHPEYLFSMKS